MAGLAVTYGLNLNSLLAKLAWSICALENTSICVERIQQYCELASEAPLVLPNCKPLRDWPSKGTIDVQNLQVCLHKLKLLVLPILVHNIGGAVSERAKKCDSFGVKDLLSSSFLIMGCSLMMLMKVRYNAHTPLVLHGLTCTIKGGKRVGIVGRTGSGKSTFIQALFRMVEPQGGTIMIDHLDIATLGILKSVAGLKLGLSCSTEHNIGCF